MTKRFRILSFNRLTTIRNLQSILASILSLPPCLLRGILLRFEQKVLQLYVRPIH
jgi:hypothetical protein